MFSLFRSNADKTNDIQETMHKSNRPPNTAFRQQRLKSWQPILLPQSVLPILILIACIFAPIGFGLIVSSNNVQDLSIDYSECSTLATNDLEQIPSKYTKYHFKKHVSVKPAWRLIDSEGELTCQLQFEIPHEIKKNIYIYYRLKNFYQNHRKYVDSFDHRQLRGKALKWEDLSTNCKPLRGVDDKAIYPCGLIANSMFNDTFSKVLVGTDDETNDYQLTNKNIAWSIDRHRYKKTHYNASDIVPPPNWTKMFPDGYTEDNIPDLHTWEEFQVWMRTAPLPKFYKLALKNETVHLPKGNYSIDIGLNYPTSIFGGSKSFVLTTTGVVGTRNLSLGIVYVIVAGLCALFALIFIIKVTFQPRAMGDHAYLNFDDESPENENIFESTEGLREIL